MDTVKMTPFVKWAGGKRQLFGELTKRMPAEYSRYYEPFIGGGALLLHMQPDKAVINDINPQLVNVYRQLKDCAEDVIAALKEMDSEPCTKERYLAARGAYNDKIRGSENDAECAALMIWMNKHCFNGIYRVNSKGLFNVPYNNKTDGASADYENLKNISEYLKNSDADIRNTSYEDACADAKEGDFVYFDPPYIPVSQTASFTDYAKDGFSLNDQKKLAELCHLLTEKGVKVMLSNNDVPLVYELYDGFHIYSVEAKRSINSNAKGRTGKEVIITNYEA